LIRRLDRGFAFTRSGVGAQVRELLPALPAHHVLNIAGQLPMYLLPLLVTARLTVAENAYFYVAWMVGSVFFIISPAVAWALLAEGSHERDQLPRAARTAALTIGGLLVPLIGVFYIAAGPLLHMFGGQYAAHGGTLLRLLILSAVPDAITNLYVSIRRVQGHVWNGAALNIAMAMTTLGLAWALLPTSGIAGAGWGWLLAQSLGAVFACGHLLVLRRRMR
jgi:O-antigen/teichoic acid export membrane protein